MAYCTLTQLTDRYGAAMLLALTDRAYPPEGAINEAVVSRAIADAGAVIDGYLAVRYSLPLAETPALVADLAQSIAIWKLHPAAPDPKIEADYTAAVRTLRDISRGEVRLAVAGNEPAATGGSGVRVTDRARPFEADKMRGFI